MRPDHTRRAVLAGLGAALVPACKRAWSPAEADPTSRSQIKPAVRGGDAFATYEEHAVVSSCAQCPIACGIRVRVVEGRAVRIEGNAENPINRGGIGVRGLAALQTLYDPDRITGPMRRVGGRLEPTTWDVALSLIADALRDARTRPEQVLVMSGQERGFTHELLARFARAFGTPIFVAGAHAAPLARAMELAFGVRELPAYDWTGAGAVLSLEAGLFEDGCRSTQLLATLRRDSGRRARLIHAGAMFDLAAYNADRWLRIHPGTAGALALGLCHVLVPALATDYTPERVARLIGCEPHDVVTLAHELWDRRPVVAIVDERSLAYSNGVETAGAAIVLSALLGGALRVAPRSPLADWPAAELDAIAERGLAAPPSTIDTARIALLYHANPAYSRPHTAFARVPLVVSFSPYLDETTADVAHLVLPDHTALERFEDATPAPGLPRAVAAVRRPAVVPLHDTRQTADVLLELARRIGLPMPWRTSREAFEARWLGLHAAQRGNIVTPSPRAFLDQLVERGFWVDDETSASNRASTGTSPPHDPTGAATSGTPPAATPYDPTASTGWSAPAWDGDPAAYPLALVAYRPLGATEAANQPWLHALRPRPGLADWTFAASISPQDLPGLVSGQRIRVTSPHGAIELVAHVDERIAPGCIAIPTGGGHTAFGRYARGFGANVMTLVGDGPLCSTRVRVEVIG